MDININNQNDGIEEYIAKNCYKTFRQLIDKFEEFKQITNLSSVTIYQKNKLDELQISGAINEGNICFDLLNNCIKKQRIILEKSYLSFRDTKDFFKYYENFIDILNKINRR